MNWNDEFEANVQGSIVVGTGLVSLDVVFTADQTEPIGRWVGGTCGNVLAIMAWLGWSAWPVARLKQGSEADALCSDLDRWEVHLDFVTRDDAGSTPVIIQHIRTNAEGDVTHRFSLRCPVCGNHLPGFRSITRSTAEELKSNLPDAAVFYFDRTSRGILELAAHYRRTGALIAFEPSGVNDPKHFDEALNLAHVVKFSDDRLKSADLKLPDTYPFLHIETKGRKGLRYRCRLEKYRARGWQEVPAFEVSGVRDTAGAGDWCTAGILYAIGGGGVENFKSLRKAGLHSAISLGQAMSAWSCQFEGARGGMYQSSRSDFGQSVVEVIERESLTAVAQATQSKSGGFACASCLSDK